ncbi:MAG: peptidoglycan-binding protein [Pseudomonadota bacterium]
MSAAVKHRVVPSEAARVRKDLSLVQDSVRRGDWLSKGDRGADVQALQRGLRDAGVYSGKISGVFDQATGQAVRAYQKARGLTVDGAVGPQTQGSLKANNLFVKDGFVTAARAGQSGQDILAAEKKLAALGYKTGKVDGVFDSSTASAVQAFRARETSLPDGKKELDRAVWQRLQHVNQSQVAPKQNTTRQRQIGSLQEHQRLDDLTARTAAAGNLHAGTKGRAAGNLQRHLKAAGINPGPVDGVYGPMTRDAVKRFQTQSTLPATGKVDAKTWSALRDRLFAAGGKASPAQSKGEHGAAVLHTEKQLKTLGYNVGKVDGRYDAATTGAVSRFQAKHGLSQTGQVNTATLKAIDKTVEAKKPRADRIIDDFKTTPPKNDYKVQTWRGVKVNGRTREMIQRAEFIMRHKYGHKNFTFAITQGSYNKGGVAASAGTHDGGGAVDIRTRDSSKSTVDHMVKAMREAGFAAWSRGRGHDSFSPHIHAIAIGDREAAWLAKSQVKNYAAGRNGLSNNALDPDRSLGRPVPAWARKYL